MQRGRATVPCTSQHTTRWGFTLTLAMSVALKSVHSLSVWPPFILQMKRCVELTVNLLWGTRRVASSPGPPPPPFFLFFAFQAHSLVEGLESGCTETEPISNASTEGQSQSPSPVPTATVTPPTSALAPPPPPPPPPPKLLESSQLKESETITWMMKHLPMRI